MKNVTYLIERSKQAVRYWWLMLLIGIALFVLGILVFVYPAQSYVSMAVLFGWVILAAGILEVVLSASSDHFVTGRGWMLAGGVIQIILGLILVFNVALSAVTLPIVLGFWLLFRGFSTIGLGGDMRAMGISGAGWTIVGGVLLLLCALWMLFQPLVFGTAFVVVWLGVALLFAGVSAMALSFQLRTAHRCLAKGDC
ncbi:MAG: hypothetical protein HFJ82_04695 [Alistipes sp.]|jgi:uncharacterized membrane protein HdeD (DUF308 family)|uniref:HdeD family acid-resistance protein n=1 Tax=Alistipes TaxID=239759 RepID=UPI00203A82EB|nr:MULTISPECIES: DUF308 domain-containing protein [Alistipes]MCI9244789.1 hypothetical protein [Alistipes sp.]MCX4282079.1 DUF308 domain-containing protein [Alistipes sp.]HUN14986.1 DUF308 domain-containing protein [Alistipes sp.]